MGLAAAFARLCAGFADHQQHLAENGPTQGSATLLELFNTVLFGMGGGYMLFFFFL